MRLPLCLIALLACPVHANDGFGGLSATGLTFGQTEAVAMEEEKLFIGIDRISVDYMFRNLTDQDVTGEVIFPLPPVAASANLESGWNLPEDAGRENLVNFTATVDGQPVKVGIDRIAVVEPPWEEGRPAAEQYDTPGRDVTADIARFGLPLSVDGMAVQAALSALSDADLAELERLGLVDVVRSDSAGVDDYIFPLWSVVVRYHWTQTFPAGKVLRISHAYENRPAGGIFTWSHPPEDYMQTVAEMYCIDEGTSKALVKALSQEPVDGEVYSTGLAYNIAYVLRTANSWAGPIKRFTLTIDKGAPGNIVSLCADGIKKTGPTTFVMEKTDYVPDSDLNILIALPLQN
jgi:hypothetical protein